MKPSISQARLRQATQQAQTVAQRQSDRRQFTIGDRIPETGQWEAIDDLGGVQFGEKIFNTEAVGQPVRVLGGTLDDISVDEAANEASLFLAAGNCLGYINGQVFECEEPQTDNPGFLFMFVEGDRLYAGGLFAKRLLLESTPLSFQASGKSPRLIDMSWIEESGLLRRSKSQTTVDTSTPELSRLNPVGGGVWQSQFTFDLESTPGSTSTVSGLLRSAIITPSNQVVTGSGDFLEVTVRPPFEGFSTTSTQYDYQTVVFSGLQYSGTGTHEYESITNTSVFEGSAYQQSYAFAYDSAFVRAIVCKLSTNMFFSGTDGGFGGGGVASANQSSSTEYFITDRNGNETQMNSDVFIRHNFTTPTTPVVGDSTLAMSITLPFSDYTYSLNYPGDGAPGAVLDYATIIGGGAYAEQLIECPVVWVKRDGASVLKGLGAITAYTVSHPARPQSITSISVLIDEVITVPFDGFATDNGTIYTNNGSIHGVLQAANIADRMIVAGGRISAFQNLRSTIQNPVIGAGFGAGRARAFSWQGNNFYTSYPTSAQNSPFAKGVNHTDRWRSRVVNGVTGFYKDVQPVRAKQLKLSDTPLSFASTGTFIPT